MASYLAVPDYLVDNLELFHVPSVGVPRRLV
jgi:hypothetical protein